MKYYQRWWQDNQHRNAELAGWLLILHAGHAPG